MWKAFAEHFKECGRNGTLFVFALVTIFPLLLGTASLVEYLGPLAAPLFGGFWTLTVATGLASFVHHWRHPDRLGRLPPLSQNELSRARAKLMRCVPVGATLVHSTAANASNSSTPLRGRTHPKGL